MLSHGVPSMAAKATQTGWLTPFHLRQHDAGAWLWCSKDDLVIDAVRKVSKLEVFSATVGLLVVALQSAYCNAAFLPLQMTKGNVGSLLVFDPEKITIDEPVKEASGDAVVGIVTERGVV